MMRNFGIRMDYLILTLLLMKVPVSKVYIKEEKENVNRIVVS